MGKTKIDHIKQVTVKYKSISVTFDHLKALLVKAGGCFIKVTTNAGFTVYIVLITLTFLYCF